MTQGFEPGGTVYPSASHDAESLINLLPAPFPFPPPAVRGTCRSEGKRVFVFSRGSKHVCGKSRIYPQYK